MTMGITAAGVSAAAAVGGLGLSAYNTFAGGGDGGGGYISPGYIELPEYSHTRPRLQATSDFLVNNINRMNAGEMPEYFQRALPTLRESMSRPLYETYYGTPGERTGVLQGAMEAGAATGLGHSQTIANVNKALYKYAAEEKAIDEYLTKLGVDITQQAAMTMPQLAMQMPQGPQVYAWGPMGVGSVSGGSSGSMEGFGKMLANNDWGQSFSDLGSMFKGMYNSIGGLFGTPPAMDYLNSNPDYLQSGFLQQGFNSLYDSQYGL